MSMPATMMNPHSPLGLSVLIVEDEAAARQASSRYLAFCGHRVAAAETASQALEQAARCDPDVVICDWKLGEDMDGVDLARELQRRYGVSIVFVSAYPLDKLRYASRDLEVSRYLRKPISLSILADTLGAMAQ